MSDTDPTPGSPHRPPPPPQPSTPTPPEPNPPSPSPPPPNPEEGEEEAEDEDEAQAISPDQAAELPIRDDFDMGIGLDQVMEHYIRTEEVPDGVNRLEVQLLLWFILERELEKVDKVALRRARRGLRLQGESVGYQEAPQPQPDDPEAIDQDNLPLPGEEGVNYAVVASQRAGSPPDPMEGLTKRLRRKTFGYGNRGRTFADGLLKKSGVVPCFSNLGMGERRAMFTQFARSSLFVPKEESRQYQSVGQFIQALRDRSKFRDEFSDPTQLGAGGFGEVYEVKRRDGIKFACKKISVGFKQFDDMKLALNEVRILKGLNHSNILQFVDSWLEFESRQGEDEAAEPLKFYILTDLCGPTLYQWVANLGRKPVRSEQVVPFIRGMIDGLLYLHNKERILHLDINPRNVLWSDWRFESVKIADFGLAIQGDCYPYPTGTPPYSPLDNISTAKSDSYSMAVTIFQIVERILTTQELTDRLQPQMEIKASNFNWLDVLLRYSIRNHPNARPTIENWKNGLLRVVYTDQYREVGLNAERSHQRIQDLLPAMQGEGFRIANGLAYALGSPPNRVEEEAHHVRRRIVIDFNNGFRRNGGIQEEDEIEENGFHSSDEEPPPAAQQE